MQGHWFNDMTNSSSNCSLCVPCVSGAELYDRQVKFMCSLLWLKGCWESIEAGLGCWTHSVWKTETEGGTRWSGDGEMIKFISVSAAADSFGNVGFERETTPSNND